MAQGRKDKGARVRRRRQDKKEAKVVRTWWREVARARWQGQGEEDDKVARMWRYDEDDEDGTVTRRIRMRWQGRGKENNKVVTTTTMRMRRQ